MNDKIDVLAVMDADIALRRSIYDEGRGTKPIARTEQNAHNLASAIEARAAIAKLIEAAKLAERIIRSNLSGSGYEAGACTDGWCPEIREQVAALPVIAAALARVGGA